ncbi:unnamed protein product [Leptosia nina]|uniref:SANT domain-containing protein n=1 Tax=Leptosia nina TaxID=320188 RepID=A0AAV1IXI5_9NEOP
MVWSAPSGEVLIDIVSRPGQSEHGHGALAYGGKQVGVAQARPAAPYAPNYAPAQLRLHQTGYGSGPLYSYGRSGGAVGEYRSGARMSLLGSAYLPPPVPPAHHPPPADPPPFKKIRLSAERPQPLSHQPLRVDTREPVMNSYNTVEVLSPNPPSEPTIEDQNFRTTKDDLLQQISKVDREMALSETTLAKLKKKQEELEQSASKPAAAAEPEEAPPRHRSLAQCIYADNRKLAAAGHAALAHLGPEVTYPLYNQPQDTLVYHENIRKHKTFRKRLAEHLRALKLEAEKREDALTEAYSRRAAEWMRRVERIEQGQKRKAKDARNREFFEKVFPELRKQREERERFNRLGARVKSEAELEEIADGLHEQEHEDKKMRSLTVVPPLLRDPKEPRPLHLDVNKRCIDMETEHKELQLRNVWTAAEREAFREKYLQHPKNFGQIASFLPRKTVRDCVRFYYLSKKAENYKQLLRKPRPRRHARPRPPPEPELVHGVSTGVTTRLQRSQGSARVVDKDQPPMEEVVVADLNGIPMPPHAPPSAHPSRSELSRTPPLPPSPPPASSAPPAPVATSIGLTGVPPLTDSALGPEPLQTGGQTPNSGVPVSEVTSGQSILSVTVASGSGEGVCVSAISLPPGSPLPPPATPPALDSAGPVSTDATAPTSVITTTSSQVSNVCAVTSGASVSGSAPPTPQPTRPPTPTLEPGKLP